MALGEERRLARRLAVANIVLSVALLAEVQLHFFHLL
jgi:hypothetical protein